MKEWHALPAWVRTTVNETGCGGGSGGYAQIRAVKFSTNPPRIDVALRPRASKIHVEIVRVGG